MRTAVVDASVTVKWFRERGEADRPAALAIRAELEGGDLAISAPHVLALEILNVFGRRWQWPEEGLLDLAAELDDVGFNFVEPDLAVIALWVARGLSAYDGAYVAVAEQLGARLVTADTRILEVAGGVAVHITDF